MYWTAKGVDGFRYDMAEMVPYEFWSYMNSAIKMKNPNAFLLAEVYNPNEYRNYIRLGKMDYLYDKVETYDKLKDIIRGKSSPDGLSDIQKGHHQHRSDDQSSARAASSPEPPSPGSAGPRCPGARALTLATSRRHCCTRCR